MEVEGKGTCGGEGEGAGEGENGTGGRGGGEGSGRSCEESMVERVEKRVKMSRCNGRVRGVMRACLPVS